MRFATTSLGDRVAFDLHGAAEAPGAGAGQAPAALFVQGAALGRANDPIPTLTARLLAERGFRAAVHDRVGRGDSAASGPISVDREIAAITAVADDLGGPVILVGHSSGCALALMAASKIDRLAGLVLWEAPLGQFPGGAELWWAQVHRQIIDGALEEAVSTYMVDMPEEWLEEVRRAPAYPDIVLTWIPDGTALATVESKGSAMFLDEVGVPVLALVGTDTFPGMPEAAEAIARSTPNGIAEKLQGAWHEWDPAAMADRLAEMLRP